MTVSRIRALSLFPVLRVALGLLVGVSTQAAPAVDDVTPAPGPRRFLSEDIFDLEHAADPRISPDGRRIVYVRRSNDIMKDHTRSALWILNVDGSGHRPLVTGARSASTPRWSPGGDRLAYLSRTEGGRAALFVRWMDTGQTATIAETERGPADLTWSPDGSWLAFTMPVEAERESLAEPPAKPEGAEWAEPAQLIDQLHYRWDGRGYLDLTHTQIFVVPASGGTPHPLTSGAFEHGGPLSWTPEGDQIVFAANRHEDWEYETVERDLFAVSVADGTLTRLTDLPGSESAPAVSPDGRWIAYLRAENLAQPYRISKLMLLARDGSEVRNLTPDFDRRIAAPRWAGSGALFFQYDDHGERRVARVDLEGAMQDIVAGLGGTTLGRPYLSGTFTVAANGNLVYTEGGALRPADVASLVDGRQRRLTELNEDLLGHRELGEVHEIVYRSSFDGTQIQGWYVTPPGFDPSKSYPLVLEIHGGPHLAYGPQFSAEIQRYAAEGYVVFYDNHRGSSSYGMEFAMLLKYKYASEEDFADHMSGVDAMIAKGFIDADNLFVTGGSAGGIAAAYAVGLTDRFKAAAAAKPVINWVSKTLTADSYVSQIRHQFPAFPWEDPDHYWKRSPLSLVGNVTTPTLLMTGELDFRTPISEAEQFYQALKLRRIDTVLVRLPDSSHGIASRPSRMIAKADNILAWFARYRTDKEDAATDTE